MFKRLALSKLHEWKNQTDRKPLILRGARQVGKTTLVEIFAKEYKQFIELNLDKIEEREIFEKNQTFDEILSAIFLIKGKTKSIKSTLIFIDEIQNSHRAVEILRYFYEEARNIHVIAAGSLLESLIDKTINFPVGRVEYLVIRPCNFIEFLLASGDIQAEELLHQIPFPNYGHDILMKKFKQFLLIGGMPEIVNKYIKTNDIQSLSSTFDSLLASYIDDVEKYSKNKSSTNIITHVIRNSFVYASDRIKFNNFGNSDYRSREVGEVFRTLEKTLLMQLVYPVTSEKLPIHPDLKKTPKLQLLDTGLVNYFAGMQTQVFNSVNISDIYEGKISEHIVGQEIIALKASPLFKLNFWTKEKKESNAEIDFILPYEGLIIPIEVKTGASGRLRSLHQFIDISPHPFAVRVYSGKLSIDKDKTINGKSYYLLNLPFYLLGKLEEYIGWFINNPEL
jgi:uncharacterized protein